MSLLEQSNRTNKAAQVVYYCSGTREGRHTAEREMEKEVNREQE